MAESRITKNYFAHGGNELVIGGKLTILDGAEVTGGNIGGGYVLPEASASQLGGVKVGHGLTIRDGVLSTDGIIPANAVPDSEATTVAALKESFNTLLISLRNAGLLAKNKE